MSIHRRSPQPNSRAFRRRLQLETLERRLLLAADSYEPNNTIAEVNSAAAGGTNSSNLGLIRDNRSIAGLNLDDEVDWYRFQTDDWGTSHDFVSLEFLDSQGDLQLELFARDGATRLRSSASFSDNELVSLAGLEPGMFFAKVSGRNGDFNPAYVFHIDPPGNTQDDAFEPNDTVTTVNGRSPGPNSPNLGTLVGDYSIGNLRLEDQVDWYRFETTDWGTSHHSVTVTFVDSQGDIDLELYAGDGTMRVKSSNGFADNEQITLAGLEPGAYFIRVDGRNGDANPAYGLQIHAPGALADDVFEPNDSVIAVGALPTGVNSPNLGVLVGERIIRQLSLEDQVDWFRFETTDWGTNRHVVAIDFNDDEGDLNLDLYSADGSARLRSSSGFSDSESVSLAGLQPGTYWARVVGRSGDANANYSLRLFAPGTIPDDALEPNDSPLATDGFPSSLSGATPNFGLLRTTIDVPNLRLEDQSDWYRFETSDWGTSHDYAVIRFADAEGDLDLQLYASGGQSPLRSSASFSDDELVSLAGLEPSVYYLRVYGRSGDANETYSLSIDPPGNTVDDRFEPNDSLEAVLAKVPGGAGSAFLVPNVGDDIIETGLKLEDQADYFVFDLPNFGIAGNQILLDFVDSQGDLNLSLLHPDGTVLRSSSGFSDRESIDLQGYDPGRYGIRVTGRNGDANVDYQLHIDLPSAPSIARDVVARDLSLLGNSAGWLRPGQSAALQVGLLDAAGLPGSVTYQIVLSEDASWDASDAVLANGLISLSSGNLAQDQIAINVPIGLGNGRRYLILRADPGDILEEPDEENNLFAAPIFVSANQPSLATVSGTVFVDEDNDSIRRSNSDGLAAVTVFADYDFNGRLDSGEPSTKSVSNGQYTLSGVLPGVVAIGTIAQAGQRQSLPVTESVGTDLQVLAGGSRTSLANVVTPLDGSHPSSQVVADLHGTYDDIAIDGAGRLVGVVDAGVWVDNLRNSRAFLDSVPGSVTRVALGAGPNFQLAAVGGNTATLFDSRTFDVMGEIGLGSTRVQGDVAYHAGSWLMTTTDDELAELDFQASSVRIVGSLGISRAYGLISGPNGWLYASTGQELVQVDPETGATAFIENVAFPRGEEIYGLAAVDEATQWMSGHLRLKPGQYLIDLEAGDKEANLDFGFVPEATIAGRVFDDRNENGDLDQGDMGVEGFWVYVDLNQNAQADMGEPRTRSAVDGRFELPALPLGSYQLRLMDEPGKRITTSTNSVFTFIVDGTSTSVSLLVGVASDAPPRVSGLTPSPLSAVVEAVNEVVISFTGPMDAATAWSGSYLLVEQGADAQFDTADDRSITISRVVLDADPRQVHLQLDSPLPRGEYRLTIRDFVVDQYGNRVDGEFRGTLPSGDGAEGGAFRTTFSVLNSVPTIAQLRQTVQQGVRALLDVEVNDAENDAITLTIETLPEHGMAQVIGDDVYYTASSSHLGTDRFTLRATDANGASTTQEINLRVVQSPADLQVQNAAIADPLALVLGFPTEISWLTHNLGPGAADYGWYDQVYFSQDPVLDSQDRLLARYYQDGTLDAGQSRWESTVVELPTGFEQGYLIVHSDARDRVAELNSDDNIFVQQFQPNPGIFLRRATVPQLVAAGTRFDVAWLDIPFDGDSQVKITLDQDGNPDTTHDATILASGIAAALDGEADTVSVQIPNVPVGSYFVLATLSGPGNLAHSQPLGLSIVDEVLSSDERRGDAIGGGSYEIHDVLAGRTGQTLQFRIFTNYNPLGSGAGDVYINVGGSHRNDNGTIYGVSLQDRNTRSGQALSASSLYAGAEFRRGTVVRQHPTYIDSYSATIQNAVSTQVLEVQGNDWGYEIVGELGLSAVNAVEGTSIQVGWAMYCGNDFGSADNSEELPDLLGQRLRGAQDADEVEATWGETVELQYSIVNQGGEPAASSVVSFELTASPNGPAFAELRQVTVPSLAAQANHSGSVSIFLPASAPTELTSAGTVYIKMVSDHAMSIEEANENNNMHLGLGVDSVAVDVTQDDFFTVLTHGFNPNPFSYAAINHSWDVTYPSAVNDYAQSLGLDDASEVHSELWASSEGWMDAIVSAVATLTAQSMAVAQPQYAFLWNRIRNYAFGRIGPAMEVAERRAMEAGARIAEVVSAEYTSPDEGPQVHLIGHSRGGGVSAFASWLLEQRGYSPAQLTTLDGYSTDWPDLSGILGDIDINAHAQGDRRVNFLVQDGLAQYVGEAITSWISGFVPDWLDFGVDEYVQSSDFIDQFAAWKAPPRSNFDSNETIVGYQGADSQHLNINDLYFDSFRDLRSPRNYLADSPMGRQDQGRRGGEGEGEGGHSFDTEWAAASSIIDGSFEYLAAAISLEPEIRSAPQLVDNPFLRAYIAWTQLPGQDLSLAWQTVGDLQLVNQSSNPRVRLSAGGGLAEQALLSQVVALPAEAMLAMQVDVLSAPTGAILQVRINEEPVASLPLDGVANGRLKVDLAEFENQIVNVTILLQSESDTTASLTIDDVRLVQPLVVESVTSEPLWLEDKSQVRLTASTATSCGTDCPEAVTFYRETNGAPGLQIGSDATLGTGSTTDSVTWEIPVDGAVFMPGIEQLYAVASSAEGATGPVNFHQLLVTTDAGPIWQNPIDRFNVNADEQVSAIDALRVINFMARNPSGVLPNEQFDPPIYYDVNGDGTVTALDALQVINFMARSSQSSADSEQTVLQSISVTETKPSRGGKREFYCQAEVLVQIAKLKVSDSSTRENSSAWSNRVDQALGWQSDDGSDASSDFGVFSEHDDLDRIVSEIVIPRLIPRVSF